MTITQARTTHASRTRAVCNMYFLNKEECFLKHVFNSIHESVTIADSIYGRQWRPQLGQHNPFHRWPHLLLFQRKPKPYSFSRPNTNYSFFKTEPLSKLGKHSVTKLTTAFCQLFWRPDTPNRIPIATKESCMAGKRVWEGGKSGPGRTIGNEQGEEEVCYFYAYCYQLSVSLLTLEEIAENFKNYSITSYVCSVLILRRCWSLHVAVRRVFSVDY